MTGLDPIDRPSPNHGPRPDGVPVDILLLHYTDMATGEAALERLCDPTAQVSAHYVVERDGRVFRLVSEDRRAWHAGVGMWAGEGDINSRSIGIEIVNKGHSHGPEPYPDEQIAALSDLCADIVARHAIPPERVLAHSDVSPDRKRDPGEWFPWQRLAEAGVGLWTDPAPISGGRFLARGDSGEPVEALQGMLALFGYGVVCDGDFGERTAEVVAAFQRHYRPVRVDGVADGSTIETLRALLLRRQAGG